ncbi:BatA domain-containing protein [Schlesneria paludicola]|uniref:BatA domain-containing protein n=1 Tax=Schlesneria paludicola TaxID=360056 RepID=UPI00029AAB3E|nr:BatA domain-containing protein [Schlesneria paludicola]
MRFDAASFAIAGAIASAVPIFIHLVNRRHYKTVHWGAMAFLREAMERHRRVLHLRDVLLLVMRMLAVLLFGFLLARPFIHRTSAESLGQIAWLAVSGTATITFATAWATSKVPRRKSLVAGFVASLIAAGFAFSSITRQTASETFSTTTSKTPVHAILLIDNSRSMGVESAGGTLFDRARTIAASFIASLPLGSHVTIIPLAGSEEVTTLDAYRSKSGAQRALDRLKLVDTEGGLRHGFELAERASQQMTDVAEKRFVLLTDAQASAWQKISPAESQQLAGWQVVNVTQSPARNLWVSHFHLEEGIASTESPSRFRARLQTNQTPSEGTQTADESFNVQAELWIDGIEVASKTSTMFPGLDREIEFAYQFDGTADPLQPRWAIASLIIHADRQSVDQLPTDNRQQIAVPVTTSIPVIFIDQYGDREQVEQNQIGETHALRHLMSPRLRNSNSERPLIRISHLRADQVSQETLRTARLVVIGGIERPDEAFVSLLHEFVQQGGPLVILAGGQFNPAAWTDQAWRNGNGILPAPLDASFLGQTPEEASQQLTPFYVDFSSVQDDRLKIEGEDPQTLSALFESTPFFKAIRVILNSTVLDEIKQANVQQAFDLRTNLDQPVASRSNHAPPRTSEPAWWAWRSPFSQIARFQSPETKVGQSQPRVLASFEGNHEPFAVERHIGAGRVVLFTSGVSSNWNLLRSSGAMYLFHRTFVQLIDQTFPRRTYDAGQLIVQPIEHRRDLVYAVIRPSGEHNPLPMDLLNASLAKATIRRPLSAGTYVITSAPFETTTSDAAMDATEVLSLTVNGAESESDLSVLTKHDLEHLIGNDDAHVLAYDEPIGLDGGTRKGYELSKALGWCALGCLLFEMGMLAWPVAGDRRLFSRLRRRSAG